MEAQECLAAFVADLKDLMLPSLNELLVPIGTRPAGITSHDWDNNRASLELRKGMQRARVLVEVLRKDLHEGITDSLVAQPPAWTWQRACWNMLPIG